MLTSSLPLAGRHKTVVRPYDENKIARKTIADAAKESMGKLTRSSMPNLNRFNQRKGVTTAFNNVRKSMMSSGRTRLNVISRYGDRTIYKKSSDMIRSARQHCKDKLAYKPKSLKIQDFIENEPGSDIDYSSGRIRTENIGNNVGEVIADTTISAAEAQVNVIKTNHLQLSQLLENKLSHVNTQLDNLIDISSSSSAMLHNTLGEYIETTQMYQNEVLKELDSMRSFMENINTNIEMGVKKKEFKNTGSDQRAYDRIFGNGFNLFEYSKYAKDQIMNDPDVNSALNIIRNFGKNPINSFSDLLYSPLMRELANTTLGLNQINSEFENTFFKVNELLNDWATNAGGVRGKLGRTLGVDVAKDANVSLGGYKTKEIDLIEKNKVNKAITEVIPSYLAKLLEASTGEYKYFDYQSGKFKNANHSKAAREHYSAISSGMGVSKDYFKSGVRDISKKYKFKNNEREILEDDVDRFLAWCSINTFSFDPPNPKDKRAVEEYYNYLSDYFDLRLRGGLESFRYICSIYGSMNKRMKSKFTTERRESLGYAHRIAKESNDAIMEHGASFLFNGMTNYSDGDALKSSRRAGRIARSRGFGRVNKFNRNNLRRYNYQDLEDEYMRMDREDSGIYSLLNRISGGRLSNLFDSTIDPATSAVRSSIIDVTSTYGSKLDDIIDRLKMGGGSGGRGRGPNIDNIRKTISNNAKNIKDKGTIKLFALKDVVVENAGDAKSKIQSTTGKINSITSKLKSEGTKTDNIKGVIENKFNELTKMLSALTAGITGNALSLISNVKNNKPMQSLTKFVKNNSLAKKAGEFKNIYGILSNLYGSGGRGDNDPNSISSRADRGIVNFLASSIFGKVSDVGQIEMFRRNGDYDRVIDRGLASNAKQDRVQKEYDKLTRRGDVAGASLFVKLLTGDKKALNLLSESAERVEKEVSSIEDASPEVLKLLGKIQEFASKPYDDNAEKSRRENMGYSALWNNPLSRNISRKTTQIAGTQLLASAPKLLDNILSKNDKLGPFLAPVASALMKATVENRYARIAGSGLKDSKRLSSDKEVGEEMINIAATRLLGSAVRGYGDIINNPLVKILKTAVTNPIAKAIFSGIKSIGGGTVGKLIPPLAALVAKNSEQIGGGLKWLTRTLGMAVATGAGAFAKTYVSNGGALKGKPINIPGIRNIIGGVGGKTVEKSIVDWINGAGSPMANNAIDSFLGKVTEYDTKNKSNAADRAADRAERSEAVREKISNFGKSIVSKFTNKPEDIITTTSTDEDFNLDEYAQGAGGRGNDDVTYYNQADPRWGNRSFGKYNGKTDTMAAGGCGPTVAAMALDTIRQRSGRGLGRGSITPIDTAKMALRGGFKGDGTKGEFFNSLGFGSEKGLGSKAITSLANNNPTPLLGKGGVFGSGTHYLLGTGTSNGKVSILDPQNSSNNGYHDIKDIAPYTHSSYTHDEGAGGRGGTPTPIETNTDSNAVGDAQRNIRGGQGVNNMDKSAKGMNKALMSGISIIFGSPMILSLLASFIASGSGLFADLLKNKGPVKAIQKMLGFDKAAKAKSESAKAGAQAATLAAGASVSTRMGLGPIPGAIVGGLFHKATFKDKNDFNMIERFVGTKLDKNSLLGKINAARREKKGNYVVGGLMSTALGLGPVPGLLLTKLYNTDRDKDIQDVVKDKKNAFINKLMTNDGKVLTKRQSVGRFAGASLITTALGLGPVPGMIGAAVLNHKINKENDKDKRERKSLEEKLAARGHSGLAKALGITKRASITSLAAIGSTALGLGPVPGIVMGTILGKKLTRRKSPSTIQEKVENEINNELSDQNNRKLAQAMADNVRTRFTDKVDSFIEILNANEDISDEEKERIRTNLIKARDMVNNNVITAATGTTMKALSQFRDMVPGIFDRMNDRFGVEFTDKISKVFDSTLTENKTGKVENMSPAERIIHLLSHSVATSTSEFVKYITSGFNKSIPNISNKVVSKFTNDSEIIGATTAGITASVKHLTEILEASADRMGGTIANHIYTALNGIRDRSSKNNNNPSPTSTNEPYPTPSPESTADGDPEAAGGRGLPLMIAANIGRTISMARIARAEHKKRKKEENEAKKAEKAAKKAEKAQNGSSIKDKIKKKLPRGIVERLENLRKKGDIVKLSSAQKSIVNDPNLSDEQKTQALTQADAIGNTNSSAEENDAGKNGEKKEGLFGKISKVAATVLAVAGIAFNAIRGIFGDDAINKVSTTIREVIESDNVGQALKERVFSPLAEAVKEGIVNAASAIWNKIKGFFESENAYAPIHETNINARQTTNMRLLSKGGTEIEYDPNTATGKNGYQWLAEKTGINGFYSGTTERNYGGGARGASNFSSTGKIIQSDTNIDPDVRKSNMKQSIPDRLVNGRGTDSSSSSTNITNNNNYTYYNQMDSRWKNQTFGQYGGKRDTVGAGGCGPTVAAMALENITGNKVLPSTMANIALEGGYKYDNGGTDPNFFKTAGKAYGVDFNTTNGLSDTAIKSLKQGVPTPLLGKGGAYGSGSHYLLGTKLDSGNKVSVLDPLRKNNNKSYKLEDIAKYTTASTTATTPTTVTSINTGAGRGLLSRIASAINNAGAALTGNNKTAANSTDKQRSTITRVNKTSKSSSGSTAAKNAMAKISEEEVSLSSIPEVEKEAQTFKQTTGIETNPDPDKSDIEIAILAVMSQYQTWPMSGAGSYLGFRNDLSIYPNGRYHAGVDLHLISGTDICSFTNGTVESSSYSNARGYYITIRDENDYRHTYQHLAKSSPLKKGDRVTIGMVVGTYGSTGVSTGNHLHYEVGNKTSNLSYPFPGYVINDIDTPRDASCKISNVDKHLVNPYTYLTQTYIGKSSKAGVGSTTSSGTSDSSSSNSGGIVNRLLSSIGNLVTNGPFSAITKALGSLIIGEGSDTTSETSSSSSSGSYTSSSSLSGNSNAEKIWNYLKGKGINDNGVAGIMGNLKAESGFEPNILEIAYQKSLNMTSSEYADSVDKTGIWPERNVKGGYRFNAKTNQYDIPIGNLSNHVGYGLAQWTYSTRKDKFLEFAKKRGGSIRDLDLQLDFLYDELSGPGYSGTLNNLKKTTNPTDAAKIFAKGYEGNSLANTSRINNAVALYNQFHSGSGGRGIKKHGRGIDDYISPSQSYQKKIAHTGKRANYDKLKEAAAYKQDYRRGLINTASDGDIKNTYIDMSGSGGRGNDVYYNQNDPRWKNQEFGQYGGKRDTVGAGGCGPTVAAMVLESLNGDKVLPSTMANIALKGGYKYDDGGTDPSFFKDIGFDTQSGITADTVASLKSGAPTPLLGKGGIYGSGSHYLLGTGMDSRGNVSILDPLNKSNNGSYKLDDILKNTNMSFTGSGGRGDSSVASAITALMAEYYSSHWTRHDANGFGSYRKDHNRYHAGIDLCLINGKTGSPIKSFTEGTVEFTNESRGKTDARGKLVCVKDKFGYRHIYQHLSSINKKKGDSVKIGEIVGGYGGTGSGGKVQYGNHLHYEVVKPGVNCPQGYQYTKAMLNSYAVDGYSYLKGYMNGDVSNISIYTGSSTSTDGAESGSATSTTTSTNPIMKLLSGIGLTSSANSFLSLLGVTSSNSSDNSSSNIAATSSTTSSTLDKNSSVDERERVAYNFLKSKGYSNNAIAGIMGCIHMENQFTPDQLEFGFVGQPGIGSSDDYENKTNSTGKWPEYGLPGKRYNTSTGKYDKPVSDLTDWVGWGIGSWTYHTIKDKLLEYAKSTNRGIGDYGMQLDFLHKQLTEIKPDTVPKMDKASSYDEAVNIYFDGQEMYEGSHKKFPAWVASRQKAAKEIMNKYAGAGGRGGAIIGNDSSYGPQPIKNIPKATIKRYKLDKYGNLPENVTLTSAEIKHQLPDGILNDGISGRGASMNINLSNRLLNGRGKTSSSYRGKLSTPNPRNYIRHADNINENIRTIREIEKNNKTARGIESLSSSVVSAIGNSNIGVNNSNNTEFNNQMITFMKSMIELLTDIRGTNRTISEKSSNSMVAINNGGGTAIGNSISQKSILIDNIISGI